VPQLKPAQILIVGCGQLGSRHLQAVSALSGISAIDVYDPRPESLQLGRERFEEVVDRKVTNVRWLSSLDEALPEGDLCIVATRADVRVAAVRDVVARLGYRHFLLEKVVAQSLRQYRDLSEFAREKGLSIWVNCKSRAHLSHKRIKARLEPGSPIIFTAQGGSHGLATNGLHAADLFAFYDGGGPIECVYADIEPKLYPSKRGTDVFDLNGTLIGRTKKGSQFLLSFAGNHASPGHFTLVSPKYRAIADDMTKFLYESAEETGWRWDPIPFDANLSVSFMTREFTADILQKGECGLPTLQECYPAHEFILSALQPHFNALLGRESDLCPIT
jgi:predicted dehydrogenase